MKVLGAMIAEKCSSKLWNPIKASQGGMAFSHLFFADDLVLFARADRKNCVAVREVLDSFCDLSGQKVSQEKSRVFFSPNVSADSRSDLCNFLGFRSTPMLGKYLGFLIKHPGTPHDFGFILGRVQGRLAGWKANLLSFAGRLVLTQAVTTTIPNYAMQCSALPAKITSNLDRLSRNFFWGSSDNKKKLHLVGWSKVTRPKKEGGLGIQAARAKNIALLAKLNWRLATEPNSLWAKVLTQKYRTPRRLLNPRIPFRTCSVTWSAIQKGELIFKKGSKWIVGRDSCLSLCYDKWLDKGELRSLIEGPLSRGEEHIQLKNVVSFSGWDWQGCTFNLPKQLLLEVKATPISFSAQNLDQITWSSNPSGNFELKEAYKLARMEEMGKPSCRFNGEWIWKVQTIPKILCFIWQCYFNSIPVRSVLASRGMEVPVSCLLCDKGLESVLHVLRDCCVAHEFWNSFPPPFLAAVFYETQLVDWLRLNCGSMKNYVAANLNWGIVFSFGIWTLWLRQNGVVFRGVRPNRNVREEVISKATEFAYVGINGKRT